jgi:hypothetical protein
VNSVWYHSGLFRLCDVNLTLIYKNKFMTMSLRQVPMVSSISGPGEYMKDLEFRQHDAPMGLIAAAPGPIYPSSYRCRGRIGRGGRLVIDRIPVSYSALCAQMSTRRILSH